MIRYSVACERGHEFEGWFPSGEAFDRQAKRRQIACADCGSTKVAKAPMAPSIAGRRHEDAEKARALREQLDGVRAHVEKNCDYVGPNFAEEARKMHYGEKDRRNIYGESSDDEARELAEEGIAFARIPWIKRADG